MLAPMANGQPDYKTIWISTAPRTGSMWLFNVTRAVLRCAGRTVLPERVPQKDEEMFDMARRDAWTDADPARAWVFKVHRPLWPDLPKSRLITSVRDPRDVLVSIRRFLNVGFEDALIAAYDVVRYAEAYRNHAPAVLLNIDYRDIEERPAEVIGRVAAFLKVSVSADDADRIASDFSRERVRQLIDATTQSVLHRLKENIPVERTEVVVEGGQVTRVYDVVTGVQTGHVSDYRSGDWRTSLTGSEKCVVQERFADFIARHGFSPE